MYLIFKLLKIAMFNMQYRHVACSSSRYSEHINVVSVRERNTFCRIRKRGTTQTR